jgi:hypothetical protein
VTCVSIEQSHNRGRAVLAQVALEGRAGKLRGGAPRPHSVAGAAAAAGSADLAHSASQVAWQRPLEHHQRCHWHWQPLGRLGVYGLIWVVCR